MIAPDVLAYEADVLRHAAADVARRRADRAINPAVGPQLQTVRHGVGVPSPNPLRQTFDRNPEHRRRSHPDRTEVWRIHPDAAAAFDGRRRNVESGDDVTVRLIAAIAILVFK
jgi:hypothetical protein